MPIELVAKTTQFGTSANYLCAATGPGLDFDISRMISQVWALGARHSAETDLFSRKLCT